MSHPERLGKYRITETLGKGAMGIVYKAFDPDIQRTVAIKTIRKELIDDDERAGMMMARFKNEARAAGRLAHPGIVAVYDYGEADELAYIAMEFVQGASLRAYFTREARMEERDIVSLMVQLLDALQHAHEAGVWHRDIKPANIIIMTNGRLKVADFGIARIDTSALTHTGAVMGSPGYMAPEQYKGEAVDWRADIFAAGVVLYQLLTGVRPFTGSPEQLMYRVCYDDPPPPSAAAPGRDWERYDPVVARAIAKRPEDRHPSAAAFKDAILHAYAEPVSPTISEETIILEPARAGVYDPSQPSWQTDRTGSGATPLPQSVPGAPAAASRSSPPSRPPTTPPGDAATDPDRTTSRSGTRAPTLGGLAATLPPETRSGLKWAFGGAAVVLVLIAAAIVGWLARGGGSDAAPQPAAIAAPPTADPAAQQRAAAQAREAERAAAAARAHAEREAQEAKRAAEASARAEREAREAKRAAEASARAERDAAEARRAAEARAQAKAAAARATEERRAREEAQRAAAARAPAESERSRAASAAATSPPAPARAPNFFRDEATTMKVATKLQFSRALMREQIDVRTVGGVVTLSGSVASHENRALAERIASGVSGVVRVQNALRVAGE
ncbi:MAG: protein kinase [Burkholderiales bacterium]|nr:protein kinase [Burkholderiales bacterium]